MSLHLELLPKYTYDDYKKWEGDWELIEGVAVSMAPSPTRVHQNIAKEILIELNKSIEKNGCEECEVIYEIDWKVCEDTVLKPDIVFTCNENSETYLIKTPKIVVEVVSPSTAKKDEVIKFEIYEKEGVDYYILVYPNDLKAKVYQLIDGKYVKVGDFIKEKLKFKDLDCDVEIDFDKIFKKFIK